jgi:PAS domain S-box-containing protein
MNNDYPSSHNQLVKRVKELELELEEQRKASNTGRQEKTRQKIVDHRLARSKKFTDAVLDNIPAAVFVKDAESLRFVRMNKFGAAMLAMPGEQVIGKTAFDLFEERDAERVTGLDRKVLETGELAEAPATRLKLKNKGECILHIKKILLRDERGNPEYIVGIALDVTDQMKREEQMDGEHILLVDDEPDLLDTMGKILERMGYQVTAKCSGHEALETFKKNPGDFDLLITDLTMPGIDGSELVNKMRGIREDLRVIIHSAADPRKLETSPPRGKWTFAAKPILTRDLARTIREVLGKD